MSKTRKYTDRSPEGTSKRERSERTPPFHERGGSVSGRRQTNSEGVPGGGGFIGTIEGIIKRSIIDKKTSIKGVKTGYFVLYVI